MNCAGIQNFGFFSDERLDDTERLFRVNTLAPIEFISAVLPHMIERQAGHLVNVGSIFGSIGFPCFASYSASKFALRGFSEALRRELVGSGIAVTYVAPRFTKRALNGSAATRMANALRMNPNKLGDVARAVMAAIDRGGADSYFGWPEKLFVRINSIFPRLVDKSLMKTGGADAPVRVATPALTPALTPTLTLTPEAIDNMNPRSFGIATLLAACALSAIAAPPALDASIQHLTHRWAKVTYQTLPAQQDDGYKNLDQAAVQAEQAFPGRAEPLIWKAIALSSAAKVEGGLTGLGKAKQARELLMSAEKIDATALSGSVYSSLGTLYAKVPGWPIGFGDKAKAAAYLKQALAINPNGVDSNFFYAEFLSDQGQYAEAVDYVNRALAAPPRAGREDRDAGRRLEAQTLAEALRKRQAGPAGSQ